MTIVLLSFGCGYTTRPGLSPHLRTVYVEPFKNSIDFSNETNRTLYFPQVETDARNEVIKRFLFDGNLKVAKSDNADLILRGELKEYQRGAIRFDEATDNTQEYRVSITVSLEMWDVKNQTVLWTESGFTGEATYFTTGSQATSEETAVKAAIVDLARRIVERTIEDW